MRTRVLFWAGKNAINSNTYTICIRPAENTGVTASNRSSAERLRRVQFEYTQLAPAGRSAREVLVRQLRAFEHRFYRRYNH